ncbi:MAG TPA: hypothetical protein VL793_11400 [Patescibacteria group bacterium]|jgi:antitoxin component YwqK of YwqJK toxin-antitoxin module|nr:hypothetical protein [Patescibacteria group bacterium]
MPQSSAEQQRIERHKDGRVRAKGKMLNGLLSGYWEWFRADGSKMRSGYFDKGRQVGQWTTYDRKGKVVKLTRMKGAYAR